jgi:flagellar protein FliS
VSYAAVSRYQQNDVFSMSPARRVVFLYGQALASLRQAGRHMETGEIEARSKSLDRAREIFGELLATLDFEAGGEIAGNLAALYTWFIGEAFQVDLKPDTGRLQQLITLVADLHGAWAAAADLVADAPQPATAAP